MCGDVAVSRVLPLPHRLPVYLPHTRFRPEVVRAIEAGGHTPIPVDVSGDDTAYFALLSRLWREQTGGFSVVEHDILVRPTSLTELMRCPKPWCAFEFDYLGGPHAGLGCVKFSSELLARQPDAMERVGEMWDDEHPPFHWCRLDLWLQQRVLPQAGEHLHVHRPPLTHLRKKGETVAPAHGCGHKVVLLLLSAEEKVPAQVLSSVMLLERPRGGLDFVMATGGDLDGAFRAVVRNLLRYSWWRRLVALESPVLAPQDALLRHHAHSEAAVVSVDGQSGQALAGLCSFRRDALAGDDLSGGVRGVLRRLLTGAVVDPQIACGMVADTPKGTIWVPPPPISPLRAGRW